MLLSAPSPVDLFDAQELLQGTDIVAFTAAAFLLVLARTLLPAAARSRARIAAAYLALAVVFGGVTLVVSRQASLYRALRFLHFFFLFGSIGRSLVLLGVDVVFGRRIQRAPPRIFRDLTQAFVYVVVVLLTLRAIGVEPGSLLTTSALLTAVIGLSLQDALGNLISGIALQVQSPFEVGDWIQWEGQDGLVGQVTEVNWRATSVVTSDHNEVVVPNLTLAKNAVRNFSRPARVTRRSVKVSGAYGVSPLRVQEAIVEALAGTPGVLREPAAWVQTGGFGESGIDYTVWYFIDDYAARTRIEGSVRDRVWYALQRAGVDIPVPIRTVELRQVSEESAARDAQREVARREKVLGVVTFLGVLPPTAHRQLAESAQRRLYAPGETIVRQGDASTELFIIERGAVVVEHARSGVTLPVARLSAGEFFGEMGLMTGEPRTATVRADTACELLVLGKESFQEAISTTPGLVEKMSDLLATRQAELESVATESRRDSVPMADRSRRLFSQIKTFFKL